MEGVCCLEPSGSPKVILSLRPLIMRLGRVHSLPKDPQHDSDIPIRGGAKGILYGR